MPSEQKIKKTARKPKTKKKSAREEKVIPVERYVEAVGRRKTAIARVRIFPGKKEEVEVNNKTYQEYFPTAELRLIIESPFRVTSIPKKFSVRVHVRGGGVHA